MEKLLEKVASKVEKLDERLDSMDKTLVKQEENLREHMRRTELLEKDVAPIKAHVYQVKGALKFLSIIGLVTGILAGIVRVI